MPTFQKSCDITQGYNYKKDVTSVVGFITKLSVNGEEIAADQTCKDPMNPTTDLPVVAVLSNVHWKTGVTDSVSFSGQISVWNRQKLALMVYNSLQKVDIEFKFSIYEYDPIADGGKYFLAFTSGDNDMKGTLEKRGDDLSLEVADERSTEVQSPMNYCFEIGIKPRPEAQVLTIATANQKSVVKAWGMTVEAG